MPSETSGADEDVDADDAGDAETTSTKTRWRFTGTVIAAVLIGTLAYAIGLTIWRGADVPLWLSATFGLLCLAAGAWAFGEGALRAARRARDTGGGRQ